MSVQADWSMWQEKQFNTEGPWSKRKNISSVIASGLNSLTAAKVNKKNHRKSGFVGQQQNSYSPGATPKDVR